MGVEGTSLAWMTSDNEGQVKPMLDKVEMRNRMRDCKERYKILANLLTKHESDITSDALIFGAINKERMCIEDYMKLFPEDVKDAKELAALRRNADEKDHNPHSLAKWRSLGYLPQCVSKLYAEIYRETGEHRKAVRRFLNAFPEFRISSKKLELKGASSHKADFIHKDLLNEPTPITS